MMKAAEPARVAKEDDELALEESLFGRNRKRVRAQSEDSLPPPEEMGWIQDDEVRHSLTS
jgi:hypothetical protein